MSEAIRLPKIVCRAKVSDHCYDGKPCGTIYGDGPNDLDANMSYDGLFDGVSVICDPCYIKIGSPSIYQAVGGPIDAVSHADKVLAVWKLTHPTEE